MIVLSKLFEPAFFCEALEHLLYDKSSITYCGQVILPQLDMRFLAGPSIYVDTDRTSTTSLVALIVQMEGPKGHIWDLRPCE